MDTTRPPPSCAWLNSPTYASTAPRWFHPATDRVAVRLFSDRTFDDYPALSHRHCRRRLSQLQDGEPAGVNLKGIPKRRLDGLADALLDDPGQIQGRRSCAGNPLPYGRVEPVSVDSGRIPNLCSGQCFRTLCIRLVNCEHQKLKYVSGFRI